MKKNKFVHNSTVVAIVFLTFTTLTQCQPSYDAPLEPGEEPHHFTQVITSQTMTTSEFLDNFLSMGGDLAKYLTPIMNTQLKLVAISYRTKGPDGKDIICTGSFAFPVDLNIKGVVEVPPFAHLDGSKSSSKYLYDRILPETLLPSIVRYLTINPDLMGAALYSDENRFIPNNQLRPFFNIKANGQVALDMRKAVAEYMYLYENGFCIPNETNIIGYSLGASTALEMAKYYTDNTDIQVSDVFVGGGIYDLSTAFKEYAKWNEMPYPALPYVLVELNNYFNLNVDFSKIFEGELEVKYQDWYDNTYNSGALSKLIGSHLHDYMDPDFFLGNFSGEFSKYKKCIDNNSIIKNYVPNSGTHIYVMYSTDDNIIPYKCGEELYNEFKKMGYKVFNHSLVGDHYVAGYLFSIKLLRLLTMPKESRPQADFKDLENLILLSGIKVTDTF